MMISPDKKWLFVTPPKTGGTAFQAWLKSQFSWERIGYEHDWHIEKYLPVAGINSILLVRNPYERCISMWWWSCMDPDREPKCFLYGTSFVRYMHRLLWLRDHLDPSHSTPEVYMLQNQYRVRLEEQTGKEPLVVQLGELKKDLVKLPFVTDKHAARFSIKKKSRTKPSAGAVKFYSGVEEELVWEYAQEDFAQFGWERLPRVTSIRVY